VARSLLATGMPCVATAEVRFLEPKDREVQRVLLAIDRKNNRGLCPRGGIERC